ncbi:MAG: molybdenum ABC transporter ATP-binding protein [Pseudomonadota bacterium]
MRFTTVRTGTGNQPFTLDVDCEVPNHGITGIFGPSGSGKTTFLRSIAGLERVDGDIAFGEKTWVQARHIEAPHDRKIGMVFQGPQLFEHMTVGQNIDFSSPYLSRSNQSDVSELCQLFGISSLMQRRTGTLSGGEHQRVAIVRALAAEPQLLLLDEPLTGLDSARKQTILKALRRTSQSRRMPMIYVGHDLSEMRMIADAIGTLDDGVLDIVAPLNDAMATDRYCFRTDTGVAYDLDVISYDAAHGISTVAFGDHSLAVPTSHRDNNTTLRVSINAREVSITKQRVDDSSIINQLPANIQKIAFAKDTAHACVHLVIGDRLLLSHVTQSSIERLNLAAGDAVMAQVKAVALQDMTYF